MKEITVVGGGLAGLIASIACAEQGAPVQLLEAHQALGGRARTSDPPYRANLGPHAIYRDGSNWAWLAERELIPPFARPPLSGLRFRYQGGSRRTPPLSILPAVLRLRGRRAPADQDFRTWAAEHSTSRQPDPERRRRRLHLPPRSRSALGRLRLGARGARPCSAHPPPPATCSAAGARWSRNSGSGRERSACEIETSHRG